jgi:hypothetical protein
MVYGIKRCMEMASSLEAAVVGRVREPHLSLILRHYACSRSSADSTSA